MSLLKILKNIRWGLEFALYRVVEWLVSRFSIAEVYRLGTCLGRIAACLMPGRRSTVRRNLRIAYGQELSPGEIDHLAALVFEKTGGNLLSAIRTAQLSGEQLTKCVQTVNWDLLREESAEGRGILLLIPHMGNWELLSQVPTLFSTSAPCAAHFRPLNNPFMDRLSQRRRGQRGLVLFEKRGSPHAMAAHLRAGGILAILADQRTGPRGHFCPFFGRFTSCSPLPEALARRTGASVLALSQRSVGPGKWELMLQRAEEIDSPGVARAVENAMRVSPTDVFWLADRFRLGRKSPLAVGARPHPRCTPDAEAKPVRVLIWFEGEVPEACRLPDQVRPDLAVELAVPSGSPFPRPEGFEAARSWEYDPSLPPEQLPPTLRRIDESDPIPLDGILLPKPSPNVTVAARRAHLPLFALRVPQA